MSRFQDANEPVEAHQSIAGFHLIHDVGRRVPHLVSLPLHVDKKAPMLKPPKTRSVDREVAIRMVRSESGSIVLASQAIPEHKYVCCACETNVHHVRQHDRKTQGGTIEVKEHYSHNGKSECSGESADHMAAKEHLFNLINSGQFGGFTILHDCTDSVPGFKSILEADHGWEGPRSGPILLRISPREEDLYTKIGKGADFAPISSDRRGMEDLTEATAHQKTQIFTDVTLAVKEQNIGNHGLRPDLVLKNKNGDVIGGMEVCKSHAVTVEKDQLYREIGVPYVQVSTDYVMKMIADGINTVLSPMSSHGILGNPLCEKCLPSFLEVRKDLLEQKAADTIVVTAKMSKVFNGIARAIFPQSFVSNRDGKINVTAKDLLSLNMVNELTSPEICEILHRAGKIYEDYGMHKPDSIRSQDSMVSSFFQSVGVPFGEGGADQELLDLAQKVKHSTPLLVKSLLLGDMAGIETLASILQEVKKYKESSGLPSSFRRGVTTIDVFYEQAYKELKFTPGESFAKSDSNLIHEDLCLSMGKLTDVQKLAARHFYGPALVAAIPGSGKTTVIKHRVANLIKAGIRPSRILCLTFTKKAAEEMRRRIGQMTESGSDVKICTFHSLVIPTLRESDAIEMLGYTSLFKICSSSGVKKIASKIFNETYPCPAGLSAEQKKDRKKELEKILHKIVSSKQLGLDLGRPEDELRMSEVVGMTSDDMAFSVSLKNAMIKANAMDFDDTIMSFNTIMRADPRFSDKMASKYDFVLVDEYQDSNLPQVKMALSLADKSKNMFVVGDDDQLIYGWRGAAPANITSFLSVWPDVREFKLEQNFRSTKAIVRASANLIESSKKRYEKKLLTLNEEGEPVDVRCFQFRGDEEDFIVSDIKKNASEYPYNSIFVLSRINRGLNQIAKGLRREGIPFFFAEDMLKNPVVQTLLNYMRFLVDTRDEFYFDEIVNVPSRSVGDVTVETIFNYAKSRGMSAAVLGFAIASGNAAVSDVKLSPKAVAGLKNFFESIEVLRVTYESSGIAETVRVAVDLLDLKSMFADDKDDGDKGFLEELYDYAKDFETDAKGASLQDWLEDIDIHARSSDEKEGVQLSTIYKAKGLEAKKVYLYNIVDGVIPSKHSTDIEEERRVLYVGATRAQKKLIITTVETPLWSSSSKDASTPSRFIAEMFPKNKSTRASVVSRPVEEPLKVGDKIEHVVYNQGVIYERHGDTSVVQFTNSIRVALKNSVLKKI